MNFQSQHLIKLKVDGIVGFKRTKLWLFLGALIISIAVYSIKLSKKRMPRRVFET